MAIAPAAKPKSTQVEPYRWTRQEYEKMVEIGLFPAEARLELIEGEILSMASQTSYHAAAVSKVYDALRAAFGEKHYIRVQMPLALNEVSEPEPDIAVVPGSADDYWREHPRHALLVVEVAYSSLDHDQERKRLLYAGCNIPEYWILNLNEGQLEIYRMPQAGDYQTKISVRSGELTAPLALPERMIAVASLLPR